MKVEEIILKREDEKSLWIFFFLMILCCKMVLYEIKMFNCKKFTTNWNMEQINKLGESNLATCLHISHKLFTKMEA